MTRSFYEFFAGGGMAAVGLGGGWRCAFANDIDPMKAAAYQANHPSTPFHLCDIAALHPDDLPGLADLAWASFPCQDLSLAGAGAGLSGGRSGMFWTFQRLMGGLVADGRAPAVIAIENVIGLMSSNGGRDLLGAARAIAELGYRVAMFTLDARGFTPQSRPRLFLVAQREDIGAPPLSDEVDMRSVAEARASARLSEALGERWWAARPPVVPRRNHDLIDLIDWDAPAASSDATERVLALMTPAHRARVEAARLSPARSVGAVYRRMRTDEKGRRVQRAEVRFDGLAGCLRTPAGGSSRQTVLLVEAGEVRSRLITAREAASLMGLPPDYQLPRRYNDAYKLCGDGVVAPVVRFIAETIIEPALSMRRNRAA
ncbi:MAG: DNA (cytosine-5-)-methyltransferase [Pseudomonadota bacterium]